MKAPTWQVTKVIQAEINGTGTNHPHLCSMDHHVAAKNGAQLRAVDVSHSHPGQDFGASKRGAQMVFLKGS